MALTVTGRGSNQSTSSGTSLAVTVSGNIAVGSLAVIGIAIDNSPTNGVAQSSITCSDTRGNTWTRRVSALRDPGAANAGLELAVFTAPITTQINTNDTVTISWSTAAARKAAILREVSTDQSGAKAEYVSAQNNNGGAATSLAWTTGSVNNNSAILCFAGVEYTTQTTTGDSDTTNGNWSTAVTAVATGTTAAGMTCVEQDKVVTATATQTWNVSWTNSTDWAAGNVVIKQQADPLVADQATFTQTVYDATLTAVQIPDGTLTADGGSPLTADDGTTYLIKDQAHLGIEVASFILTGRDVLFPPTLVVAQQTYTLTGVDVGLKADRKITAEQASFAATGYGSDLDVTMPAVQATFAWTVETAGLKADRQIAAAQETFAVTGYAAGATATRQLAAAQATFAVTGYDAGLDYVPDEGNPPLSAEQQSYTLTGNAAGLVAARRVTAEQGSINASISPAGLIAARQLAATQQTYTLTGNAAGTGYVRRVTAEQATFAWTGQAATVTWSGIRFPITKAEFYLTGIDVRPVKPSGAVYVIA